MLFENTGFSNDHWSQFSETEFIAECMKYRLLEQYGPQRDEVLRLAYEMLHYDIRRITNEPADVRHKKRSR